MGKIDYGLLEKLNFTQADQANAVLAIRASDLLEKENMDRFMRVYGQLIKALEPAAAGAGFCNWFRSVCLVQQYAVSVCNTALDLSLSNLVVQLYLKDQWCCVSFKCHQLREHSLAGSREAWRKDVFTTFYRNHVRPLLASIAASTGHHIGLLWGQLPTGFPYYIEMFMNAAADESIRKQVAEDYRFLSQGLEGEVFGRKKNPFDVKYRLIDNPQNPEKPLHMKVSCCMHYRTEGGSYCYTCPRLSEQERMALKAHMTAGAST